MPLPRFAVLRFKRADMHKVVKPFVVMGKYDSYAKAQMDIDTKPSDRDVTLYYYEIEEIKDITGLTPEKKLRKSA